MGVRVGGTGVTVGGTRVAVGSGVGVTVDGTGVDVGSSVGVTVGGTRAAVGSSVGVTVDGTRVAVGSPAVVAMRSKGVGLGDPVSTKLGRGVTHCTTKKASRETMAINNIKSSNVLFSTVIFFRPHPYQMLAGDMKRLQQALMSSYKLVPFAGGAGGVPGEPGMNSRSFS